MTNSTSFKVLVLKDGSNEVLYGTTYTFSDTLSFLKGYSDKVMALQAVEILAKKLREEIQSEK